MPILALSLPGYNVPAPLADVCYCFLSILLEGAPYIVFGTLVSGFIDAFLPSNAMERLLPKRRWLAVVMAAFLGAIFPVCECAIVPIIRRLIKKGLPVSCAITYMLSAPIVNPVVAISTWSAFQGQGAGWMLGSRLGLALLVSMFVGWFMLKSVPSDVLRLHLLNEDGESVPLLPSKTNDQKVQAALRTSMDDFLDTAMYFALGVLITSVFNTQLMAQPNFATSIAGIASVEGAAIPCMMILASILSLCSTTDAFIAANMQGFPAASKLAFLVFGPMIDVKLIFMYSAVFRRKFVIGLTLLLFALIAVLSLLWTSFFPYGN